jgi:hypothetical protein
VEEGRPPSKEGLGSGDWGPQPPEIMRNLPRRRPYRPTGRRKSHSEALQTPAARATASRRPPRSAASRRTKAQSRARGRSSARKAPGGPGLPELALNATVEAAKIPLGVTAAMARRAVGLVGRGSRSD